MKRFILLTITLLLSTVAFSQKQAVKPPFTKGVNFSLWFQPESKGTFISNTFTEHDFKNVKALGCDAIRLPIHFENLSSGAPNYIIDEKVFSVLDKAIQWASENQIYLILDNHSWHNDIPTAKDIDKRLLKYWPQIATRYKDSGKYLVYELLNEPHGIDNKKWAKVQQTVINAIRAIDSEHPIVVGGGDYNSYNAMMALPNFSGGNIIYTFHYYDPMLFTHQGAEWINDLKRLKGIPFPYDKDKMPPKPKGATGGENWHYDNYKQTSDLKSMEALFEKLADFSIKRNSPIWCGEFGAMMKYAPENDRIEWYKTVVEFMDSRNIARTSWDYYDSFGLFKYNSKDRFPNDLNTEILAALKYDIPKNVATNLSWYETGRKNGDYIFYKNGFANGLHPVAWLNDYANFCTLEKDDSQGGCYIELQKMKTYASFRAFIKGGAELSEERNADYVLEFEARTKQNGIKIQPYFVNSDKTGEEWRCSTNITNSILPPDNEWHKIRIPLKKFLDIGAWNNAQQEWINSRGLFDWNDIQQLAFENQGEEITQGIDFREIHIVK